jgi:hypothetical protein
MASKPHARIVERNKYGVHTISRELSGFNGKFAVLITNGVGTMWCAYIFAALALISLPDAIKAGTAALIAWIAQTFLQLVLLSIIMVGQKVAAAASDKQAYQTYKDAEALLEISNDIHTLIKTNNDLTEAIHQTMCGSDAKPAAATPPSSSQPSPSKPPAKRRAPRASGKA